MKPFYMPLLAIVLACTALTAPPVLGEGREFEDGAPARSSDRSLDLDDVVRLSNAGIGDDVIVAQIEASGTRFELSADDILELKQAGVSNEVLAALVRTGVEARNERAEERALEIARERPRVIVRVAPDPWYGVGWYGYRHWAHPVYAYGGCGPRSYGAWHGGWGGWASCRPGRRYHRR